jgi:oxygen-dependent protoporphyrinogen oxidase
VERFPRTIVVVGGGIAGLATAFSLQEQAAQSKLSLSCTVLEASSRCGGKILTHRVGDLIIDAGPDSFLSQKPAGLELCEKLGLADQLINTNETPKKASVFFRGRLHELPEGLVTFSPRQLGPFLRSGLLSWGGLARMGLDVIIPATGAADESLASFFRRRFGSQAFERVIEPLMAGIYAGDAEEMSVNATFPRFVELERQYGSIIRGMAAARRRQPSGRGAQGPRRTMFVSLKDGLDVLVDRLSGRLQQQGARIRTNAAVASLRVRSHQLGRWMFDLSLTDGSALSAEAVVLATPAFVSADLVRPLSPMAAGLLEQIPYASTATISLAYEITGVSRRVEGFGFVVPRAEKRSLIAATWTSLKWPHRAPSGQVLVRGYVGGVGREEILKLDDQAIVQRVAQELDTISGVQGTPRYTEVNRWDRAMPQYRLGHLRRLQDIEQSLDRFPGLVLTGAAYRGIGIPDCISDGKAAADRVLRQFAPSSFIKQEQKNDG